MAMQPLVFPPGASHEVLVNAPEEWIQHGLVEASVVVDPTLHHRVEHACKVAQGLVTALTDPPAPQFSTHLLERVATHRWQEVDEVLASLASGETRAKRVPQELESLVGIGGSAIRVLAVHDAGLVWMQLQTTVRQPSGDGIPNELSLLLRLAVHHCVVAIPLEPHIRELLSHPYVERIMQEQIG
jgi:hypothetical protein